MSRLIATITSICLLSCVAVAGSNVTEPRPGCRIQSPFDSGYIAQNWTGECKDGFAHGAGRVVWRDGDTDETSYEGDVIYGAPQGKGKLIYWDGDIYEGEFSNGEPHGYGVMKGTSGDIYEGFWRHGHEHGAATFTNSDGGKFQCLFNSGARSQCWLPVASKRPCKLLWPFEPDEPRGEMSWSGACKNGRAEGKGIAKWRFLDDSNPSEVFDGRFIDGAMNGQGTLAETRHSPNGEEYLDIHSGVWLNSKRSGLGKWRMTHTDETGRIIYKASFDGLWRDDRRNGLGTFIVTKELYSGLKEIETREGVWKDDFLNGPGRQTTDKQFADGESYYWSSTGEWSRGQLEGFGIEITKITKKGEHYSHRLEGMFSGGAMHGKGIATDQDGNEFKGVFDRGEEHLGVCNFPKAGFQGPCKRKIVSDTLNEGGKACLVPLNRKDYCIPGSESEWVY